MPVLKRRINKTRHEGCRVDALSLAGDPRATELPRFAPIFKRLDNLHHRRHHRRDRLLVVTSFGWDSAGDSAGFSQSSAVPLASRPESGKQARVWQAGPSPGGKSPTEVKVPSR